MTEQSEDEAHLDRLQEDYHLPNVYSLLISGNTRDYYAPGGRCIPDSCWHDKERPDRASGRWVQAALAKATTRWSLRRHHRGSTAVAERWPAANCIFRQ
jgi:hypothetical protein